MATVNTPEDETVTLTIQVRRGPEWLAAHGYPPDAIVIETHGPYPADLTEED